MSRITLLMAILLALAGCEEDIHGDPVGRRVFDAPAPGTELDASEPLVLSGHGEPGMDCCSQALVAIRKGQSGDCLWWQEDQSRFEKGRCRKGVWLEAESTTDTYGWSWRANQSLPPGDYTAFVIDSLRLSGIESDPYVRDVSLADRVELTYR